MLPVSYLRKNDLRGIARCLDRAFTGRLEHKALWNLSMVGRPGLLADLPDMMESMSRRLYYMSMEVIIGAFYFIGPWMKQAIQGRVLR